MEWQVIRKLETGSGLVPNLLDYGAACRTFSWPNARAQLAGLPNGGINIAYEAVDRHVQEGRGERIALRVLGRSGDASEFSYAALSELSNRFANALATLGIMPGDRVFTLLGREPALYLTALGTWKHGAILCPLFSAFGPEPIAARMAIAQPVALITSARLYQRKIAPMLTELPYLRHVILTDDGPERFASTAACTIVDLQMLLDSNAPEYEIASTSADMLATLHFTSGTTGKPKAAMHVHAAVIAHRATAISALDLRPDDVYWCTADPGWVTGTSYGIIGPLSVGCTLIVDEDEFDAERWYRTLAEQRVSVWYTAPTAIRMLIRAGDDLPRRYDLSALRFIASVGEPLNPEAVVWGQRVLGLPIHDNWWQSETGGIMVSNFASMDIKPGSMGRPLPGVEAAVVRLEDGRLRILDQPDEQGELALRVGWPSMFRGYLGEDERYRGCFVDGWYLSGDVVRRDQDGYYWFVGRSDDVIKSAGHLIGPFEVESALMEHPAVAEAAAIGIPDPVAMEVVKAYVVLKRGVDAGQTLHKQLLAHARKRLGPAVAPREIEIRDELPRTRSGKIMRRLLKARELGLPEGDTSTVEHAS